MSDANRTAVKPGLLAIDLTGQGFGRLTDVREFHIWRSMVDRCENPENRGYHNYGGRGIAVSAEWHSFGRFYADMGPRPSPKHEIDRYPDNDGPYCKGNCRWATRREQSRNRRTNRMLTLNGETMCVAEWAERLGLGVMLIHGRLRDGYSDEEALTVGRLNRRHDCCHLLTFNGKTLSISEWGREVGIRMTTIRERLKRGWSVERALTEKTSRTSGGQ